MDTQKVKKSSRLKGSVLYTVTLVMMVMLILMMSAIALAGTANKRAFGEYHDDQTTYTGRSVIDSVLKTLGKDETNEELGIHIINQLGTDKNKVVTVNVNNKEALPDGYGTVEKLEFRYVGMDNEGGFYITGSGRNIFKVTATVKMGNEVTTYSKYLTGSSGGDVPPSGGAGFLSSAGIGIDKATAPSFHGPSYTQTLPDTISPLTWPNAYEEPITIFRNPVHLSGGALFGSTIAFTTSNAQVSFTKNLNGSNGLTIMGNLALLNDMSFLSEYTPNSSDSITNIPYIYCDGTFYTSNKPYIGVPKNGTDAREKNPINLYVGRIVIPGNEGNLYSSIYCYNSDTSYSATPLRTSPLTVTIPSLTLISDADGYDKIDGTVDEINDTLDGTSSVSIIGANGGGTQLLDWADATVGNKSVHSGSIYTKGSLKLGVAPSWKKVIINGDICVEQILDMTDTSTDSAVNGSICVNGQLMVQSADQLMTILSHNTATKVVCRSITDASGNDLSGTTWQKDGTTYDVTISTVAFTWPTGMEKSDILGQNNKNDKIVATQDDAFGKFYDVTNNKYKRSINESMLDVSADTEIYYYNDTDNEVKMRTISNATAVSKTKTVNISKSCTIAGGTFKNCTFNITPPIDEKIWINLYDVKFDSCKIIVDDSEGREVYFYIPQGTNFSPSASPNDDNYFSAVSDVSGITRDKDTMTNTFSANNTQFLTKNYDTTYFGGGKSLVENLDLHTYYKKDIDKPGKNELNTNFVPDLYICAADNTGAGNQMELKFDNECVLTGHIIALNSHLTWINSSHKHGPSDFSYTVDGATVPDTMTGTNISVIGSVFICGVDDLKNDFEFYYVDYQSEDDGSGFTDDGTALGAIDGYISY